MVQQLKFVGLRQSLAINDVFALTLVQNFPFLIDAVDQDMTLVSNVYQSLSSSLADVAYVRLALAAAGRLQAIAMVLQLPVAYQQYTALVEVLIHWLDDLDMYLRRWSR